ncbi:hypothetical protein F1728_04450 [Gimesia benthica]|uniref:Uncharacterized protein n=1 Tax=Gimesia benthica TaxID=2608982 RepID=A0A6I6A6J8_9PLAN|nr:hypothetical protein [Gimesia benthica]QGQ21987.1 hypothetical protein F1728_04450 [Gimesia benthica]
MTKLENTKLFRGGVTAPKWGEILNVSKCSIFQGTIKFDFEIDSKGGGKTQLKLVIEEDDVLAILNEFIDTNSECVKFVPKFVKLVNKK